ncbi:hypothetical protein NDU88_005232 [Pleurodeles waltl]|uniref:Uncharacterized protein n=1 Tax=Pleurodeles waltl TaxID=8319 RepID=A0AAV7TBC7_PLEWA|nr:hypothetical protein NDU88_005232 [Pleurodeles waltl]
MKAATYHVTTAVIFMLLLPTVHSHKERDIPSQKWNYREGAGSVNLQGKHSITQTLEKWGNNIFFQCKNILMNRPQMLLPEYSRVRSLSEALDDLLKEMLALKKRLVELNDRLDAAGKALPPIAYNGALDKMPSMHSMSYQVLQSKPRTLTDRRREKLTQPPHRPYPLKRRVYIRRKVKGLDKTHRLST